MAGRKIRDQFEARSALFEAEASGLTRVEWARHAGVDARSLNMWRLSLAKGAAPPDEAPALRLVELVSGPAPATSASTPRYTVHCGELSVEVDERFEDSTLLRLLQVVASC